MILYSAHFRYNTPDSPACRRCQLAETSKGVRAGRPNSRSVLINFHKGLTFFEAVAFGVTKRAELLTNFDEPAEMRSKWPPAGVEGGCLVAQAGQRCEPERRATRERAKLKGLGRGRNPQPTAATSFDGGKFGSPAQTARHTRLRTHLRIHFSSWGFLPPL